MRAGALDVRPVGVGRDRVLDAATAKVGLSLGESLRAYKALDILSRLLLLRRNAVGPAVAMRPVRQG